MVDIITALAQYREAKIDMGIMKQSRWNQQNCRIRSEVNQLISKIEAIQRDQNSFKEFANCGFAQSQDDKNRRVAYENDILLFKSMKVVLVRQWYKNLGLQVAHLCFLQREKTAWLGMENFARSTLNLEEVWDWDINVELVKPEPDKHGVDDSVVDDDDDDDILFCSSLI